jgi:2-oxoisovalerate dehydrogenase E1 component
MHKQGRTFFHIAGAGHEALLTGLARSLRPDTTGSSRTTATSRSCSPRRHPDRGPAPGRWLADDMASAGRQMPSHWGNRDLHIVTQSSPTGSQCLPAVGCAEATRYLQPKARGPRGARGRGHLRLHRRGCNLGGRVLGEPEHGLPLALPIVYLVADNGYAISVPTRTKLPDQSLTSCRASLACSYAASMAATTSLVVRSERRRSHASAPAPDLRYCTRP